MEKQQNRSLSNLSQAPLYSDNRGFVLSDALAAVAVVTTLALLAHSAVQITVQADQKITESYQDSDEAFRQAMDKIGECICKTEGQESEEPQDTSLNSF